MNIALLCALIIITVKTDAFHVGNTRATVPEKTGERISPRKLQSYEQDDPKEAKTTTWNQILADALVNRIKVFSFRKVTENERITDAETSNNFLTNCISQMMHLYKILIYDKINRRPENTNVKNEDTELRKEGKREPNNNFVKVVNIEPEKDVLDPKDEVEIIEPRYHGKLHDNREVDEKNVTAENETNEIVGMTQTVQTTVTGCPAGLVASDGGGCMDPKSKFILSIPYQCPIGYRRDWLGYCRPQL